MIKLNDKNNLCYIAIKIKYTYKMNSPKIKKHQNQIKTIILRRQSVAAIHYVQRTQLDWIY